MEGTPATYDGTLTFSGNNFTFDIDEELATVYSYLGTLTDTRLVINRTGTIDAVSSVPEPTRGLLLVLDLSSLMLCRKRRA